MKNIGAVFNRKQTLNCVCNVNTYYEKPIKYSRIKGVRYI